ncbi:hybrid sensor histidine kinase/response regulator [Tahibacter soli]|uniref:histidine kinase n=1 Tax=Tahibacter soli TaxID=2983605 RepID=A0A9X3YHI0_9GAMM|nr:hybrid sensor histidine kinase/response regulator [Tahibacter soli]MDC8011335.1 two-component regulator propeller domain-containing protein [Tahibacter soli]
MLPTLLLALAWNAAPAPELAATPLFRRYGAAQGLPSSTVYKLAQDRDGFVWVGTQDGLARYDGVAFRVWRNDPDDPASIAGNEVSALLVDRDNRVWVGGEGTALNVLDPQRRAFRRYRHDRQRPDGLAADDVWAIAQDRGGAIWVGTYSGGLDRLRDDGSGFDHHRHVDGDPATIASDTVLSLYGDDDGSLWIGTNAGLDRRLPDGRIAHVDLGLPRAPQVTSVVDDGDGVLAATSAGLYRVDADARARRVDPGAPRMVYGVARDRAGDLWLATRRGIVRRAGDRETAWSAEPLLPGGLPGDALFDVFADVEGGVWIAALDGGVAYLDPGWRALTQIRELPNTDTGLTRGRVQALAFGAGGALWSVNLAGAVDRIDLVAGKVEHWGTRVGGSEVRRRSIHEDRRGRLWIGQQRGVRMYDPATGQARDFPADATRPDALPEAAVDQIAEADDAIWFSARGGGIVRIDAATLALRRFDPGEASGLRDADVEELRFDAAGTLWVAHAQGLDRYDAARERFAPVAGAPEQRVHAFAFARDGSLWLHRFGALERYARDAGGVKLARHIDADDGWPALAAGGLALDARERLWIATPRGLYRVDPERRGIRHFDANDGLLSPEFVDRTLALRADGVLAAATLAGVVALDTARENAPTPNPPMRFTAASVRRGDARHAFDLAAPIELAWNDRDLRVEARVLSYAGPNRYQFLLDGFDDAWTDGGSRGERELAQLPAGDYRLRLRAAANGADPVEASAPLLLRVAPPPWATPWAYALYALLVAAFAWAAILAWRRRVERRHAYALASQRRALAEQASASKTDFLAHLGHEIRTPMTGLLGMTELLERTGLDTRQRNYAEAIRMSGKHMLRIVNDVLDLARIEAGRLELELEAFDPAVLLRQVGAVGSALAERKGIACEVRAEADVPRAVLGDLRRVRQVLLNLVNNAVKFTSVGGVALRVGVEADGRVCFEVRDSGPGIAAELRQRLFQRYEQGERGRRAGGSGLGLAICRELTELMGGDIGVDSTAGSGSCFRVRLPLQPIGTEVPSGGIEAPRDCDVLIVQGDPVLAQALQTQLVGLGARSRIAANALTALAALETARTDIVLFDLVLPGVDGFGFARLIRQREAGTRVPLVALLTHGDADAERRCREAGVDGVLWKPITLDGLVAVLDALCA